MVAPLEDSFMDGAKRGSRSFQCNHHIGKVVPCCRACGAVIVGNHVPWRSAAVTVNDAEGVGEPGFDYLFKSMFSMPFVFLFLYLEHCLVKGLRNSAVFRGPSPGRTFVLEVKKKKNCLLLCKAMCCKRMKGSNVHSLFSWDVEKY